MVKLSDGGNSKLLTLRNKKDEIRTFKLTLDFTKVELPKSNLVKSILTINISSINGNDIAILAI